MKWINSRVTPSWYGINIVLWNIYSVIFLTLHHFLKISSENVPAPLLHCKRINTKTVKCIYSGIPENWKKEVGVFFSENAPKSFGSFCRCLWMLWMKRIFGAGSVCHNHEYSVSHGLFMDCDKLFARIKYFPPLELSFQICGTVWKAGNLRQMPL